MLPLPTGTVTFLFTDIEGSTPLWESQPDAMRAAIQRHHAILRAAVEAHHGEVFNIAGDAFCVAFATAGEGLAAALEAQRAFHSAEWGAIPLRVRMGLHSGSAEADGNDYRSGPTLNRVARVMALAHGGQTLISQAAAELVRRQLPAGVSLRDLGEHRLKGLPQPERILQVVVPDLPNDFPPLKSAGTAPNNLPLQLTSFIGREGEIAEVKHWLATARLVTLTGAGGSGKTRLSLQVAGELLDEYADGVWLVELAPLANPSFVPHTVASALKIPEQPGRPLLETLTDFLRDKHLLLILDNCEHLIEASAKLADALLRTAPRLTILASSREALNIGGELAWRAPSLETPEVQPSAISNQPSAVSNQQVEILSHAAVRLFVDRATFANASFRLTQDNAPVVAQICRRLDGMPLAIELAAARVKALAVEQIAARLDDRFRLLTTGSRTAVPRQQTLRAAIDWSYDQLSEPERILLRRLSVFAGGWTLEAAEAVCADEGVASNEVLDLLTHLVGKSLLVAEEQGGAARYRMLETTRQYARERHTETKEEPAVRTKHLEFFAKMCHGFDTKFYGPLQVWWLDKIEIEHDNIRTAIEWSQQSYDQLSGMRLVGELRLFWFVRHPVEGLEKTNAVLSLSQRAVHSVERVYALICLGYLQLGNYTAAQMALDEALVIARGVSDDGMIANTLILSGQVAFNRQDYTVAHAFLSEALEKSRAANVSWMIAYLHHVLGDMAVAEGDLEKAWTLFEESVRVYRPLREKIGVGVPLRRLGQLASWRGDYEKASAFIRESFVLNIEGAYTRGVASCLTACAALVAAQGRPREAARLWGAVTSLLGYFRTELLPFERGRRERNLAALHAQLDTATFDAAWAEGHAMTLEQAIAEALRTVTTDAPASPAARGPDDSSAREREVLSLVAQGLSDAQVAEKLVLSPRTVNSHLTTIYRKLGVNSRSAATRYALDHKLV